jgi:hypothetical protein
MGKTDIFANVKTCNLTRNLRRVSEKIAASVIKVWEIGGDCTYLWNICRHIPDYTVSHSRKRQSSNSTNAYSVVYVSRTYKMHLIALVYFYCDVLNYTFGPVVRPSTGWCFCNRNTVWSHVSDYPTMFEFVWLLVRIFRRIIAKDDRK